MDKNIYKPQYESLFNNLEKYVALAINGKERVKWWHRIGTKGTNYAMQGWKKENIYPDFLLKIEDGKSPKFYFLETKGTHLKNNEDSRYKKAVFDAVTKYAKESPKPIGEFNLINDDNEIHFDLVNEDDIDLALNKIK